MVRIRLLQVELAQQLSQIAGIGHLDVDFAQLDSPDVAVTWLRGQRTLAQGAVTTWSKWAAALEVTARTIEREFPADPG